MTDHSVRVLVLGAHPDDAEYHAGGLCSYYAELGYVVKMVSVTNGGAGHHQRTSESLVDTRRAEAAAAGQVIQSEYDVWDFPDGRLVPDLQLRSRIIRELRTFQPDLVLTHRTNDYHPDHRAVGQAVQDASYMVTVPLVEPETPILESDPIVAYMPDLFTRPNALRPDIVFDITDRIDVIVEMLASHVSQVFEFLPFNQGIADQVPDDPVDRVNWLTEWFIEQIRPRTQQFRDAIADTYGEASLPNIQYVEVLEVSEYAGRLDDQHRQLLFPFLPT